jgi:CheY-like chemotaxis protein
VRILVVEDVEDTRELYRHFFDYHGMRVATAPDGLIALQAVAIERPDVIVLDLAMPRMTGWEVLRALKRRVRTRDIPILAVSGVGTAKSAREAGADAFLEKPVEPSRLLEEVLRVARTPRVLSGQ